MIWHIDSVRPMDGGGFIARVSLVRGWRQFLPERWSRPEVRQFVSGDSRAWHDANSGEEAPWLMSKHLHEKAAGGKRRPLLPPRRT